MKQILPLKVSKTWYLPLIFNLVLLQILIGMLCTSGCRHLFFWAVVFTAFNIAFWGWTKIFSEKIKLNWIFNGVSFQLKLMRSLMVAAILFVLIDLYFLGGLPMMKALEIHTVKELVAWRTNAYSNVPFFWVYIAGWNLKAILPFIVFYSYRMRWRLAFWFFVLLSSSYAFMLMQKSFCIVVLMPAALWILLSRDWKILFVLVSISFSSVFFISSHHNNVIKHDETFVSVKSGDASTSVFQGLIHRVFVIPGEIVSLWLDVVPDKEPFLYGRGYGVLAYAMNQPYENYDLKLYRYWKPSYVKQGVQGRVNTATFMREYSNFGYAGLLIACVFIAFVLYLIQFIFGNDWKSLLSLMGMPVLLLSSSNLLTIFFSGGAFVFLLLYLLFGNDWKIMEKV
jgi:hypothetical protein